jgi:putative membrane-bound dehydrogenase-like protein
MLPFRLVPKLIASVSVLFGSAATLRSYEAVLPPPDVQMPAAKTPAQSLAAIQLANGLQIELVAAEPLVMDPIDVVWGPDGRMWVVEMTDYPNGVDGRGTGGGRIRVLESTRGDGIYDKSTVFAERLLFPKSVLPWRKGVLVTAAPDILYLEDTDGDGKADRMETLYTGLAEGNQQHRGNGLQWGLDGWLYMANGDSGGTVRSLRTGQSVELGRRDFRIKPDEGLIETQTGRTQFGRNRDDWGNWFGGNNSNPAWHYALEEHYLRRNPHLAPPNAVLSVPKIPGAAPVYRAGPGLARFNDPHGENAFTGACGVMIYRDDLLGAEYAGNLFVSESVHNLVHRLILQPTGVTFTGDRAPAEQESEFLASTDDWSRFTYTRAGPDGALYVVDMYRLVIEHPKWIPDEWQALLGDLRAGHDLGRVYRVFPKGASLRPVPRLDRADAAGLVAALDSPSGVVRDLAQQQLVWREEKGAAAALRSLVTGAVRPETRVQALCTLDLLEVLSAEDVERALGDSHPGVRRHAVRLSERFTTTAAHLLPLVITLADDADAFVRKQVAYTLGEWRVPEAGAALARLVQQTRDPLIIAAAMSSALPHADTMLAQLHAAGGAHEALLEIAISTQNMPALASWVRNLTAPREPAYPAEQFTALAQFTDTLARSNLSLSSLRSKASDSLRQAIAATGALFAEARTVVASRDAPLDRRTAATALLGRGLDRQQEDTQLLIELLAPQTPVDLQLAAVTALGRLTSPTIPERLLAGWNSYGARTRNAVLDVLISRQAWADRLLDWIASDPAIPPQIGATQRTTLTNHGTRRIAYRAIRVLNAGIDENRQKVIDEYLVKMSPLKGDAAKGRDVYLAACANCHKFGELAGGVIGPDMAAVNDRSRPYLVTHILDPNRVVDDRSMLYTAVTNDGRTLSGMLVAEAGNSITFAGLDGVEQVILRSELESLTSTGRSLMPDGLEAAITPQDMADLVAFLAETRAAPASGK